MLLLNGSAAVWAMWVVGGERQRAERSEKAEQVKCVKTDSLPGQTEDFGEWRRKMRLRSRDLG